MKEEIVVEQNIEVVKLDLHGDTLYETKTDLPALMAEYYNQGFTHFQIIHGFKSGDVLQNYVRYRLRVDLSKLISDNISIQKVSKGDTWIICGDISNSRSMNYV